MDKIYDVQRLSVDQEAIRFELAGEKIVVETSETYARAERPSGFVYGLGVVRDRES